MSTEQAPPLYDRLGGVYAIAAVVDDFIDRIMIDPALNVNPLVDEAHHRVGKAGFKYLVTEMVGWATGGPEIYGLSLADSHAHSRSRRRNDRLLQGLVSVTLDKFSVPAKEQRSFSRSCKAPSDIVSVAGLGLEQGLFGLGHIALEGTAAYEVAPSVRADRHCEP